MALFDDYSNLYTPQVMGLLGLSQGFAKAGAPSPYPVGTLQALNQGFAGGAQGLLQGAQLQEQARMAKARELLMKQQGDLYGAQAKHYNNMPEPLPGQATDALGVRRYTSGPLTGQVVPGFDASTPTKPAEPPSSVREFEYAQKNGYQGSYEQWVKDKAKAGASSVTVTPNTSESPFYKGLGEGEAKTFQTQKTDAEKAAQSMQVRQEARKLLDAGVVTGSGAEFVTNAGKILERVGIPLGKDATETIHNTQVYAASMGREVGSVIRMFGSGTGLSDADRAYAEKIAGGKIELDEGAIRKLLDINDRLDKAKLRAYNKKARKIEQGKGYGLPYGLQIPIPGEPNPGDVMDGYQFIGGDPGNRMNWRKAK